MLTPEKVQKAFHVFGIIAKIAMIFCIIGAVVSAHGALCLAAELSGSHVVTLFGKPVNLVFFCFDGGYLLCTDAYRDTMKPLNEKDIALLFYF